MTRTLLRRTLVPLSLAALVAAVPLAAESDDSGRRGWHRGHHRGGEIVRGLRALDLTEDQRTAVQEIVEAQRESSEPLREELKELHERMREIEEQANPNPTELGQAMLDARAVRDQMKASWEAARADVEALLTAEQRDKLELLKEMRPERRRGERSHRGPHRGRG